MKNLKVELIPKGLKTKIKKLQDQYLMTKAQLETVEYIEHENKSKVLANNIFTDEDGQRITEVFSDFLINDKEFNNYLELVFIENKSAGLPVTDKNICIDWKYKKKLMEIEKELFELQLETVPSGIRGDIKKAQNHHKFREKALDLILKLDCTI